MADVKNIEGKRVSVRTLQGFESYPRRYGSYTGRVEDYFPQRDLASVRLDDGTLAWYNPNRLEVES